jgi:hypothetical protein
VFTFLVVPLPLIVLTLMGYWVAGLSILYAGTKFTEIAGFIALAVEFGSFSLPSMFVTALICQLGRRAGLRWQKTALACLPIVLFSFIISTSMRITEPAHGTFMIGFCLPFGHLLNPLFFPTSWPPAEMIWRQSGCAALPACLMVLLFLRERSLARALASNSEDAEEEAAGANVAAMRQAA